MKKITYSAPAKVIISGEHAVVFGKPALVSAINMRLRFSIWEVAMQKKENNIQLLINVVKRYLIKEKIKFENKYFDYNIASEIPIGRGLGSSAAFCVAGVAAISYFYTKKQLSLDIINQLAYQCEKHFHKNPSGVDPSMVCYGGLIYYRKEFEFLKNISRLNITIPKAIEDNLYLIDTGKPQENTGEIVVRVGALYNKEPERVEDLLNQIEKVTRKMTVSIIKKDTLVFQECINENQMLLAKLGVVSKNTIKLLEKMRQFGVGKITGAGGFKAGSGFILSFAQDKSKLEKYCQCNKLQYYKFKQSEEGLKREE